MNRSLGEIHLEAAERWPDALAVVDGPREITYGELARLTAGFAAHLRRHGLVHGERVGLLLGNRLEFLIAHLGVLMAGGVSVPLPVEASASHVLFCADDADISWAVVQPPWDVALTSRIAPPRLMSIENWPGPTDEPTKLRVSELDRAVLMYTTGTSGLPKAVDLSHRNTVTAVDNMRAFIAPDRERELLALPLSHSFGLGQAYLTLVTGGTLYLHDGLKRLRSVLTLLAERQITSFATTPAGYQLLFDRGGKAFTTAARSLRLSVVNSSPLPPSLTHRIREALPAVRLIVYYGLTEASRSTFIDLSSAHARQYSSVGRPPAGVTIELMDENGEASRPGFPGEIVIRGATVARGYWNRPEETAAAFANGALRTGDLGYVDEHGLLFLTGRLKDQINVGGAKVSPYEVESVVRAHPDVIDAAACAVPDALAGERVGALVVLRPAAQIGVDQLAAFCSQRLPAYAVPVTWALASTVPKTDSGKILRDAVRAQIQAGTSRPC